jgi:hypothetical protein
MPLNDNEFDQLFRDRLRGHSSPVGGDLWRRVHTRIGSPVVRGVHLLRHWRWIGAGAATVTVAFAAHLVLTPLAPAPKKPAHPTANHYSSISAAANRPGHPVVSGLTPTDDRIRAAISAPVNPETNRASIAVRHEGTVPNRESSGTSGRPPSDAKVVLRHPGSYVDLPNIAQVGARPGINARRVLPVPAQTPGRPSKSPITLNSRAPFHPFTFISVYGSPDFPNKDYDYSWTGGVRFTWQFARHWSVTTGVQYVQLNVPEADFGGIPTSPFHFSNVGIPVLAGYTTNFSRYNLTVTGGVILNVSEKAVGFKDYILASPPWDREGNDLAVGFEIERPVNSSWAVFLQPYVREQLYNGEFYFPSKTITNGVLLGARYRL